MKKSISSVFFLFTILIVTLSCGIFSAPVSPASIPSSVPSIPSTDTPSPIPPTITPEPTATNTLIPSPTLEVIAVPTIIVLPQQWNGTYTYTTSIGAKQPITFLIERIDGTTFKGKMLWHAFSKYKGAILKMNGEFITDFGDEVEQIRWSNLDDYKSEDKSGYWLKWTETEVIDGGNYTVNGWYYAHIREDGTMVAVYFYNDKETTADKGTIVLNQVVP